MPPKIDPPGLRKIAALAGPQNLVSALTSQQSGGIGGAKGVWDHLAIRTGNLPEVPALGQSNSYTVGAGMDVLSADETNGVIIPMWRVGSIQWVVGATTTFIAGVVQLDVDGNPRLIYDVAGIHIYNATGGYVSDLVTI